MPQGSDARILIVLVVSTLFGIITFALAAATLGTLNRRLDYLEDKVSESLSASGTTSATPLTTSTTPLTTSTTPLTTTSAGPSQLVSSIKIDDVMGHLRELQKIADESNGTRAVSTIGFNRTLDYIRNTLSANTNFNVSTTFFPIRQFALNSNPIFISSIGGAEKNYTFSEKLSEADFYYVQFSTGSNSSTFIPVTVIPNLGCNSSDWQAAPQPVQGRVALVKRGVCAFSDKGDLAVYFNVSGLLIYNDGNTSDRMDPMAVSLGQKNNIPALFLSYKVGNALAEAANNGALNVGVRMTIDTKVLPESPVGNICADTPTGDATQTIVIGSHSDSVPEGPGINDNGSGSAANLGLAIALARLFEKADYAKYPYRVRFCWWGAEEIGLLGSEDHVQKAKVATAVGERLQDYLINLNYDMLGSPNFIFGIYNGSLGNEVIPEKARQGSENIRKEFQKWFNDQNLPSTLTSFDGRSDYGPFLAEGIVAGGVSSGADGVKTKAERDEYNRILGGGLGGIAGIIYDPCYHQACDSIDNIHVFGYEKLVKSAAHMLEYLGHKSNLTGYLYPNGRATTSRSSIETQNYRHAVKERFGFVTI